MKPADRMYELLPAIYRVRDAEQGGKLRALVEVLAREADVVERDIANLYEDWFIETCDEWLVPYIGDLLGVRGLHSVSKATFSQRARVANTLAYRRRKGTATMLEQLARDTTGWYARAVEFFELLGTTQYYNHIRLHSLQAPDLRRTDQLELLDTPFDRIAHTVDVRHIASRRGRHNLPNIGLFLWRLQNYPLDHSAAREVPGAPAGRYRFNAAGLDSPPFNSPQPEIEIGHLAEEINVPDVLRRRPLYDELEARRRALVESQPIPRLYFNDQNPVFQVFVDGSASAIAPEEILICDLSDWHLPPDTKAYVHVQPDGTAVNVDLPISLAVDPQLGRMTFPASVAVTQVHVNYSYGFSGDVGGGPYNRQDSVTDKLRRPIQWQAGVSKQKPAPAEGIFQTLADAVAAWNAQPAGTAGMIAILDSDTYGEDLTGANGIEIPEGSWLMLVAADWPKTPDSTGILTRIPGNITPAGMRPHLLGQVEVIGTAPGTSATPGEFIVNGLLIEGDVHVLAGHLGRFDLDHSTIVPRAFGLTVAPQNEELKIRLEHSICGPIELPVSVPELRVVASIVDSDGGTAIVAPGSLVEIQASTVLGTTGARTFEAGNSVFTATVEVERRQTGCVRFCFVADGSHTPRRFRCQPDLALAGVNDVALQAEILARMVPGFVSREYGQPAYTQLKLSTPGEIRTGADDGADMGVWNFLKQPQRETNLLASLDEYLRFGLEAGTFFVT